MSTYLNPAQGTADPRSSSTPSLHPPSDAWMENKRKLLLIYVHGFLGDETSFQHFPSHVHRYLSETLEESHTIHTKIYPRYKTRNKVEEVREVFSKWLTPHESPDQDIVLLGHSMGGILTAEVVLLPLWNLGTATRLKHRIMGTLNFDVPFLGMHPGIIGSGLGSLIRPAPKPSRSASPAGSPSSDSRRTSHSGIDSSLSNSIQGLSSASLFPTNDLSTVTSHSSASLSVPTQDPNYDPSFANDVHYQKRTGWSNAWHFVQKHSKDLVHASETLASSYLEFGGALADYRALKRRYEKIRGLEDGRTDARVRFVNYYTVCTGRPKRIKHTQAKGVPDEDSKTLDRDLCDMHITNEQQRETSQNASMSSRSSFGQTRPYQSQVALQDSPTKHELSLADERNLLTREDNNVVEDDRGSVLPSRGLDHVGERYLLHSGETQNTQQYDVTKAPSNNVSYEDRPLSCISKPPPKDLQSWSQGEADQKDDSSVDEHATQSRRLSPPPRGLANDLSALNEEPSRAEAKSKGSPQPETEEMEDIPDKPRKDRKFCILPRKVNGERDACWVKVFMPDVDEVGAHCGLFSIDENPERYELFVQDVSLRIVDWLSERS